MDKIYPINNAETIIVPAFDKNIFDVSALKTDGAKLLHSWDSIIISSDSNKFCVSYDCHISLEGYNSLRIFMALEEKNKLTVIVNVDGQEKTIITSAEGEILTQEFTGELSGGQILSSIRMEFEGGGGNRNTLYWIGLLNTEKEIDMLKKMPRYDKNSFEKYIDVNAEYKDNNIFFNENDLDIIKGNITLPEFNEMLQELKAKADKLLKLTPEEEIRAYLPSHLSGQRYVRTADRGRQCLEEPIILLSIAGYLFDNKSYSHMAARMIMSAVVTPYWVEGPTSNMQGSNWHMVCFMEDHYVSAIGVALSFMGHMFSHEALNMIMDKLQSAYAVILQKCLEPGYRWFMNQGLVGNRGRIIAAATLANNGRISFDAIENSYLDHCHVVNNYLNEEGHCPEGLGYYTYSFITSILLWLVYAKCKKSYISEVVPHIFKESKNYVEAMLSSNTDLGNTLPTNVTGLGLFDTTIMLFVTIICNWDKGYYYLNKRKEQGTVISELFPGVDLLLLLRFMPKECSKNYIPNEKIIILQKSGLFSYEFFVPKKGKLIYLCERDPMTCHYHDDRGSVILEYNGKTMLADPGSTSYDNPIAAYISKQSYHNVSKPINGHIQVGHPKSKIWTDEAGIGCTSQISLLDFGKKQAKLLYVKNQNERVSFSSELTDLYDDNVCLAFRDGTFVADGAGISLELNDLWKFNKEDGVELFFISYCPFEITADGVVARDDENMMTIKCNNLTQDNVYYEVLPSAVDAKLTPLYRLRIYTDAARNIELRTDIRII